jgi:hypothetical protein
MELNQNFNEPKSTILKTRIMWKKERVLFRHIDSMSKKVLIGFLIGYKMVYLVFFTSRERAKQKCKDEKQ